MIPTADFDPRRIEAEALIDLRKLCLARVIDTAPRFGEWLRRWLEAEELRRREMPDKARLSHAVAVPNDLPSWPNADVGDGLTAVAQLGFVVRDEALGLMMDRLSLVFAGEAQRRLKEAVPNG